MLQHFLWVDCFCRAILRWRLGGFCPFSLDLVSEPDKLRFGALGKLESILGVRREGGGGREGHELECWGSGKEGRDK